uniref:Uncharacterized protein n=1 Tax=Bracon brevicornis TaxID=1563983 RepID=A0A6V7LEM0_9HYME
MLVAMKSFIAISIFLCFRLINSEPTLICEWTHTSHKVCRDSDIIVSVEQHPNYHGKELQLINARGIADNAFKDLDIGGLIIKQNYTSYNMENEVIRPPPPLSLFSESFNGLPNLTKLLFYDTKLIYKTNQLAPLRQLKRLLLTNSDLTEVPSDMFPAVKNLSYLRISYNVIPVVRDNAFVSLTKLRTLELVRNNMTTLEPGWSNGLDNLTILDLTNNDLTLTPYVFSNLKKVRSLIMYHPAKPSGISPQAFRGLSSLTDLFLENDGILTLESGMFDDSNELKNIRIWFTTIHHVPTGVFNNLKSLTILSLVHSGIKSIEPGAFYGLNLTELDLGTYGYNGKVIESGTFTQLNVSFLSLNRNYIREIKPRAFDGLKARKLNLSFNSIKKLVADTFAGAEIEIIDLRFNKIDSIDENAFKDAKIRSLIVDPSSVIVGNETKWGIPESIKIEVSEEIF